MKKLISLLLFLTFTSVALASSSDSVHTPEQLKKVTTRELKRLLRHGEAAVDKLGLELQNGERIVKKDEIFYQFNRGLGVTSGIVATASAATAGAMLVMLPIDLASDLFTMLFTFWVRKPTSNAETFNRHVRTLELSSKFVIPAVSVTLIAWLVEAKWGSKVLTLSESELAEVRELLARLQQQNTDIRDELRTR